MPYWKDGAKYLRNHFRKLYHRHKAGHIAEMHWISRARYHRSIRHIQRNKKIIQSEKMIHVLMSNSSRDLWSEVRKVTGRNGRNGKISSNADGTFDSKVVF